MEPFSGLRRRTFRSTEREYRRLFQDWAQDERRGRGAAVQQVGEKQFAKHVFIAIDGGLSSVVNNN